MLISTAKEVRDGKRPKHKQAIEAKKDFVYGWAQSIMEQMMSQYHNNNNDDDLNIHQSNANINNEASAEDNRDPTLSSNEKGEEDMDYKSLIGYLQL